MPSLWNLDPAQWRPHALHDPARTYPESNCFLDAVIELVAAIGGAPEAMLGAGARGDFEGDQWTFFKPPAACLRTLYGLDLHEMVLYRGLEKHLTTRIAEGNTLFPEVDAFYLPDTAGTTYRQAHEKTSVIVEAVDPERRVLHYFHNGGFFELSGDDYAAVLALDPGARSSWTPYVDQVAFVEAPLEGARLRAESMALTRAAVADRPEGNPWTRLADFLQHEVAALAEADPQGFHELAFVTVRMAGSSFELLADHARWLLGESEAEPIATELMEVVEGSKRLLFQMARRRAFDVAPSVAPIASSWQRAMDAFEVALATDGTAPGEPR